MFTKLNLLRKIVLAVVVLAIALTMLPAVSANAAGLNDQVVSASDQQFFPRVERLWQRAQRIYERQGDRLERSDAFIARAQVRIDWASQNGRDMTTVQSALDAMAAVIPAVRTVHQQGASIIANHKGFDANGLVTDKDAAVTTVRALFQVIKDTRAAMNGTGKAFIEAVRELRAEQAPKP
jgi:hypothetical protein